MLSTSRLLLIGYTAFGSFFWALVLGTGMSLLLERDKLRELQDTRDE